jgi:hypothetical protein
MPKRQLKFTQSYTKPFDDSNINTRRNYANKRTSPYPFDKSDVGKKPSVWYENLPKTLKPPIKGINMVYYYELNESHSRLKVTAGNDIDVLDFLRRQYGSLEFVSIVYQEISKDNHRTIFKRIK